MCVYCIVCALFDWRKRQPCQRAVCAEGSSHSNDVWSSLILWPLECRGALYPHAARLLLCSREAATLSSQLVLAVARCQQSRAKRAQNTANVNHPAATVFRFSCKWSTWDARWLSQRQSTAPPSVTKADILESVIRLPPRHMNVDRSQKAILNTRMAVIRSCCACKRTDLVGSLENTTPRRLSHLSLLGPGKPDESHDGRVGGRGGTNLRTTSRVEPQWSIRTWWPSNQHFHSSVFMSGFVWSIWVFLLLHHSKDTTPLYTPNRYLLSSRGPVSHCCLKLHASDLQHCCTFNTNNNQMGNSLDHIYEMVALQRQTQQKHGCFKHSYEWCFHYKRIFNVICPIRVLNC